MKILNLLLLLGILSACKKPNIPSETNSDFEVSKFGTENHFELATWNIENFPKEGEATVSALKNVIEQLDVDFIAVQEISNVADFRALLSQLPEWNGGYSSDVYSSGSYQKTGYLYKRSMISISDVHNIFNNDPYAFPRPPLMLFAAIKDKSGTPFDFNLIILHLKAMGGAENEARRRAAADKLKDFIDSEIAAGADSDFVVLGDWNDHLNDDREHNIFRRIIDDSVHYQFLTQSLDGQYSYISTRYPKSLIDHILITADTRAEYGKGLTKVLYLDEEYEDYKAYISDHRPVVVRFNGFYIDLP
jgi:endonuclease/exonuclease/phosphatase family metal-dependent hydrolase